jgi:hypothetical protein
MSSGHPYRSLEPIEPEHDPPPPEDFGALRSTHEPPPRLERRRTALAAACGFSAILFGILLHARRGDLASTANVLLLLAAFILLGLLIRQVMPPAPLRVAVFEHGVAVVYPNESWKSMTFQAVDEVWYTRDQTLGVDRSRGARAGLMLVNREGRALDVPLDVEDREAVFRAVYAACTHPLVAEAERALARGEELSFGEIRFDQRTVVVKGKPVPWREVDAAFHTGHVVLTARGETLAVVKNDAVPHPRLFAHLVRRAASKTSDTDGDAAGW